MKPQTIPMILLTLVIITLAAGLIYYVQLYASSDDGDVYVEMNGNEQEEKKIEETQEDFSCNKEEYEYTDACQYVDLQVVDVDMPKVMKKGLKYEIEVEVYNAGKDTTQGYEIKHYYYNPNKKIRVEVGSGISVYGIHNSGRTKKMRLYWIPEVTGRYKYIMELYKIREAGMTDANIEKGLIEFDTFVNVEEASMACKAFLKQNKYQIEIEHDDDNCNILEKSELMGAEGSSATVYENKYIIIGDHIVFFDGTKKDVNFRGAMFMIDGNQIASTRGNIGESKVEFEYEDIKCEFIMETQSRIKLYRSIDCPIKNEDEIAGRTDTLIDNWYNTYERITTLSEGMYTIINQEIVKLDELEYFDNGALTDTFHPIFEVNGEKIGGNEAKINLFSTFGK